MKKFLAILLACVMTLALAVPAMATGGIYDINIDPNIQFGTITTSIPTSMSGAGATLTITPDPGYKLDSLTVIDGNFVQVNVSVSGDIASFIMPKSDVIVTAVFEPEVQTTTITEINATIKPVIGEKISDFEVEIEGEAKDGVRPGFTVEAKVPTGQEDDNDAWTYIEEDEVFQEGYSYLIQPCYFYTVSGYEIADEAVLTINGHPAEYEDCRVSLGGISAYEVIVTPQAAQDDADETTIATTTAAATTATSTATKTGDSSNAMTYVITLIALIACAGVTVFAASKKR